MDGFCEVVSSAWSVGLPDVDACRLLDFKLRNTAKALRAWSTKSIDSVRSRLTMARMIMGELDVAQESRALSDDELELCQELKRMILGLTSLSRMIARQRSCIRFLRVRGISIPNSSTYRLAIGRERTTFRPLSTLGYHSLRRRPKLMPSMTTSMASSGLISRALGISA